MTPSEAQKIVGIMVESNTKTINIRYIYYKGKPYTLVASIEEFANQSKTDEVKG